MKFQGYMSPALAGCHTAKRYLYKPMIQDASFCLGDVLSH